jgi:hypothetical protein
LKRLIFVNINWFNDPKFGCHALEDMGKVVEIEVELTKDLEKEFKDDFECGKNLNLWD